MTELIELPVELTDLAVKVSIGKQSEVNAVLSQIFAGTADWEKQVDAIDVKDIYDKMSIELAEVARKNSKLARLNAEKIFDAKREEVQNLKAEFDLEDKLWLKAKQVMQLKFKAIEDKAEWKATYVKRFEAQEKELRTQTRFIEVSKYAEINRIEFENMSEESFTSFLTGLKTTHDAKIEAAKKTELERIEKEKAEVERIEKQRVENERLKIEAQKREKAIEAERKLNAEKLAKEREIAKVEAEKREKEIEAERKLNAEKAAKEREKLIFEAQKRQAENKKKLDAETAKLLAQIEAKKKLEAELKAKQIAESFAEKERVEAINKAKKEAEKLAKAPIKKQMNVWVDSFELPVLGVANETSENIYNKFAAFKKWAKTEIEAI